MHQPWSARAAAPLTARRLAEGSTVGNEQLRRRAGAAARHNAGPCTRAQTVSKSIHPHARHVRQLWRSKAHKLYPDSGAQETVWRSGRAVNGGISVGALLPCCRQSNKGRRAGDGWASAYRGPQFMDQAGPGLPPPPQHAKLEKKGILPASGREAPLQRLSVCGKKLGMQGWGAHPPAPAKSLPAAHGAEPGAVPAVVKCWGRECAMPPWGVTRTAVPALSGPGSGAARPATRQGLCSATAKVQKAPADGMVGGGTQAPSAFGVRKKQRTWGRQIADKAGWQALGTCGVQLGSAMEKPGRRWHQRPIKGRAALAAAHAVGGRARRAFPCAGDTMRGGRTERNHRVERVAEGDKGACSCMGFDRGQAANDSARAPAARCKHLGCARGSEGGCPQEQHPKATAAPVQSGGSASLRQEQSRRRGVAACTKCAVAGRCVHGIRHVGAKATAKVVRLSGVQVHGASSRPGMR